VDPNSGCLVTVTAPPGTPCDDGQTCTTPDACDGSGTCLPGPKNCTDPTCKQGPVCQEVCDNCIDDNGDGLIDGADTVSCPSAANGGARAGDRVGAVDQPVTVVVDAVVADLLADRSLLAGRVGAVLRTGQAGAAAVARVGRGAGLAVVARRPRRRRHRDEAAAIGID